MVVGKAEDDLWAPIEATLDIDEARFELGASGSKINYFDRRVAIIREKNVFRLQIAVYDLYSNKVQEPVDKLRGQLSQQVLVHASEARPLDVLIQVHAQELKHDDVVAAEVEAVEHLDDAILVRIFAKDTV